MREAGQSRGQTQRTMRHRGNLPDPSGSPGVRAAPQRLLHWEGAGLSHPCTSQWWPASLPGLSPWGDCLRLSAGLWGRSLGEGYTGPEMRVWQGTNSTCYRALPPPHFPPLLSLLQSTTLIKLKKFLRYFWRPYRGHLWDDWEAGNLRFFSVLRSTSLHSEVINCWGNSSLTNYI